MGAALALPPCCKEEPPTLLSSVDKLEAELKAQHAQQAQLAQHVQQQTQRTASQQIAACKREAFDQQRCLVPHCTPFFAAKHSYNHGQVSLETGLCEHHTAKNQPLSSQTLMWALKAAEQDLAARRP